jgi:hypothetical protein
MQADAAFQEGRQLNCSWEAANLKLITSGESIVRTKKRSANALRNSAKRMFG